MRGVRHRSWSATSHVGHRGAASEGPLLTVIVPVYNEAATVDALLTRVHAAPYDKQVIVVDDGSSDETPRRLATWSARPGVELVRHATNRGKGAAIRTALARAAGRFTIVQDADLEYDPGDYPHLIEPLLASEADVVYGSRYLRRGTLRRAGRLRYRLGLFVLNSAVWWWYGRRLSDEATCYKALATDVLQRMQLVCERFEFCPEVTAKACRLGLSIKEVPIHYDARSVQAGKKIRLRDGLEALRTLWRWRRWEPTHVAAGVRTSAKTSVFPGPESIR